ncbi:MAG: DUF4294 domain-containing protein [Bacteroidaceae bacterium]|nr:DUF4294 domain-containing protein [Bacteroidaceae bacterium]
MLQRYASLLLLFLAQGFFCSLFAQEENTDEPTPAMPIYVHVSKTVYKGDSVPHITLPTFYKRPPMVFKSEKERKRYNRLVANVKKTLPIAKLAKMTIVETYDFLETLPTEKARKEHIKRVEAGLKKQYTPLLKKMTRSQGRLLVKLIDRECNQTGYSIAKAFVGPFKANMYQSLAFIFGQSLTKKYDPEGDDMYLERVVVLVESGQL